MSEPWKPTPYEDADAIAFKALAAGVASEAQQRRALDWIVRQSARTYDMSYRPGPEGERDTAFAEGRRAVGLEIVKLINLSASAMKRAAEEQPKHAARSSRSRSRKAQ